MNKKKVYMARFLAIYQEKSLVEPDTDLTLNLVSFNAVFIFRNVESLGFICARGEKFYPFDQFDLDPRINQTKFTWQGS